MLMRTQQIMSQKELTLLRDAWPLRMPRTPRALLELLALSGPGADLTAVLDRVDWSSATPALIHYLVHGVVPAAPHAVAAGAAYDPRRHMSEELHAAPFQRNVLPHLLRAFPDVRRDVFIHVPKCAGTDLILNLAAQRVSIGRFMEETDWLAADEMLAALAEVVRTLAHADDILVHGHIPVPDYASRIGVRPGDRMFTVIRDPIDLIVSQANHNVSRLLMDPSGGAPDSRAFLAQLGMTALPADASATDLRELAIRALHLPEICQHNTICSYLGGFAARNYEAAACTIIAYDIEVAASWCYNDWLQTRFGITPGTRHNASQKFLGRRETVDLFGARLDALVGEDQKLFDLICWALRSVGKPSVSGAEIARLLGGRPLDEIPRRVAAERGRVFALHGVGPDGSPDLAAVVGKRASLAYLDTHPALHPAPSQVPRIALDIAFGRDGDGGACARDGWSNPEPGFRWTTGQKAVLHLPRPRRAMDYMLQLVVRPFVWERRQQFQRVYLGVNGEPVGSAAVAEYSVLECRLPWSLIGGEAFVAVELSLPDAVRPVDVNGAADTRELAIALERALLFAADSAPAPLLSQPSATAGPQQDDRAADHRTALMLDFESLGENCEFGLVQRRCGIEPLGLLRFSSTPLPPLLHALRERFAGMGAAGDDRGRGRGLGARIHDLR